MNEHTYLTAGVAMCVYNGARFLREQLESIAAQSVPPVQMVVLDDGSTDGSWELLQAWAATAPFEVEVRRNAEKLGVVRNFERAATLLDTSIVFLADQDDLWYPDKVSTFLDAFSHDPSLSLLHSDADLVDGEGRPLNRRLFDALLVTPQERAMVAAGLAWRVYAKRNLVTGAAAAFRRDLLDTAVPFSLRWVHDEWLAFVAALAGRVTMLDTPTMAYRLHGGNTVGLPVPTLGWRIRSTVRAFTEPTAPRQQERANRLEEMVAVAQRLGSAHEVIHHLERAASHARFRSELPGNPIERFGRIWQQRRAGHYHAWSNGPVSMLHDLLIAR